MREPFTFCGWMALLIVAEFCCHAMNLGMLDADIKEGAECGECRTDREDGKYLL